MGPLRCFPDEVRFNLQMGGLKRRLAGQVAFSLQVAGRVCVRGSWPSLPSWCES